MTAGSPLLGLDLIRLQNLDIVSGKLKQIDHEGEIAPLQTTEHFTSPIEPIDASEWVSPLVVVRKRDGNIRLCVDLREPNKCVIMDCYPLPHMEDLFTELAGAPLFVKG